MILAMPRKPKQAHTHSFQAQVPTTLDLMGGRSAPLPAGYVCSVCKFRIPAQLAKAAKAAGAVFT